MDLGGGVKYMQVCYKAYVPTQMRNRGGEFPEVFLVVSNTEPLCIETREGAPVDWDDYDPVIHEYAKRTARNVIRDLAAQQTMATTFVTYGVGERYSDGA